MLVGLFIYQLYKLLSGSIAFNILMGLLLVYFIWFLVRILEMELLQGILSQFINVGVIALLIVFQPEVRKFLLFLGRGSRFNKYNLFWKNLLSREKRKPIFEPYIQQITSALENLARRNLGAIIVLSDSSRLQFYASSGVILNSAISGKLIESIFEKNTPLHDGAIIIADLKIIAAGCILPVSDNPDLPSRLGLRHRATVGITEHSDAMALAVSEETGEISYARNGRLLQNITIEEVTTLLSKFFDTSN